MSGIAEVLCNLGYTVQGSDASESANVNRLRDKGIRISPLAGNVAGVMCWWCRPIKRDNPIDAARAQRIPVAPRHARADAAESCVAIASTMARPPRPRWSPHCSMPAISIRP
jgi:UDP-N-acetylmuramate--alanine ligase